MIHAVEGERHAENVGFGFGGLRQRVHGNQLGVRLALAAIEGMGAFASRELAGQDVPAGAVGGGQIVKVRVPADVFRLALAQVAMRAPQGLKNGSGYHHQHGVESAQENVAGGAEVKTVVPRKHNLESPCEDGLFFSLPGPYLNFEFALFRKDLEVAE